jgi:hypothetical protein
MAGVVAMVGMLGDILIDLRLQGCQQHTSGTLAHQCVEIELEGLLFALVRSDYAQHAAYRFVDSLSAIRLQQPGGYAALLTPAPVHNFRL